MLLTCSRVTKRPGPKSKKTQSFKNSSTRISRWLLRMYQRRFLSTPIRRASSATLMPRSTRDCSITLTTVDLSMYRVSSSLIMKLFGLAHADAPDRGSKQPPSMSRRHAVGLIESVLLDNHFNCTARQRNPKGMLRWSGHLAMRAFCSNIENACGHQVYLTRHNPASAVASFCIVLVARMPCLHKQFVKI